VVTRQLQVERGTGKDRRSKTSVLTTVQRNQPIGQQCVQETVKYSNIIRMTDLDVLPRFVLVEVPQATVVAVRKPVLGHPVLLPTVAAAFSHDAGYQRRRTDVELQPLFGWTDHTRTQCLPTVTPSLILINVTRTQLH